MSSLPLLGLTLVLFSSFILHPSSLEAQAPLPGTKPLTMQGDLAAQMVASIRRFYLAETERVAAAREGKWKRDFSDREKDKAFVTEKRGRLANLIGSVRLPAASGSLPGPREEYHEYIPTSWELSKYPWEIPPGYPCDVAHVRWRTYTHVDGQGLLLTPKGAHYANVILLPDCDE